MPRQRVTLTLNQKIQIQEWLRDHREWVLAERPSQTELVRKVCGELGFEEVSPRVVKEICDSISLTWQTRASGSASNQRALSERLEGLDQRFEELWSALKVLEEETPDGGDLMATLNEFQGKIEQYKGFVESLRDQLIEDRKVVNEYQLQVDAVLKRQQSDIDTLRGLVHELYHQSRCVPPMGYQLPPKRNDKKLEIVKEGKAS